MRPESLTVAVRPRHSYEAADLGAQLIKNYSGEIYRCWLMLYLPLLAGIALLCYETGWPIAALLVWWLKPLMDYIVLWQLSRLIFGVRPGMRDVVLAIPTFFRHGLLGALTWRRLSMSRSVILPVRLLEGLKGEALRSRIRLMQRDHRSHPRLLLQVFAIIEMVLLLSQLSLLFWFGFYTFDTAPNLFETSTDSWGAWILALQYALAVSVVEPLYVASGFMMYLNRRTLLEAWDVELAFRTLANRFASLRCKK